MINPVISYTLDGRLREGNTYLERSALGVSLDSGLTEGASCLEPLEQSFLSSSLVARPIEGITEKVSDWKSGRGCRAWNHCSNRFLTMGRQVSSCYCVRNCQQLELCTKFIFFIVKCKFCICKFHFRTKLYICAVVE